MAAPSPDAWFARLRAREFARLDRTGIAYLDYTGSAIPAASHLRSHQALLRSGVFGNPHSLHAASAASSGLIDDARRRVAMMLDASDDYVVCFTANTTAAVRLVAEAYPFDEGTPLVLSADNHNSINGLREYARVAGSPRACVPLTPELRLTGTAGILASTPRRSRGLFAFPAQSNFSGVRHPLSLVEDAHALGYDVLVDAAAYLPSGDLSLREHPADFVVFSFYKLLGYPTGLGALVARRDALARLRRPSFAGGTVDYVSIQLDRHQPRPAPEGFEDGTPNFLAISAVRFGIEFRDHISVDRVGSHGRSLARRFVDGLQSLTHANGRPAAQLYGPETFDARGATVAFNLLDSSGAPIPFELVEQCASDARVMLRGGCFCNPGAAEAAFAFDRGEMASALEAITPFSIASLRARLPESTAVGAVRASFGTATIAADVDRALEVMKSFT